MPVIAIVGAGPIGAAIAHRLAERARFREICLVDENVAVASGKALDIRQSGPIGRFDVNLAAAADLLAAAGAEVIVLADAASGAEWDADSGLPLLSRLARSGTSAPIVCAGPSHQKLMERAHAELKIPADRLIGSAASAQVGAARALVSIELGASGADVHIGVVGRPPAFTIGWSAATVAGSLLSDRLAAHRMIAIGDALARLWPPGPQSIGAATSPIVEALAHGSGRLHYATTILDGSFGPRGEAAMLPLELGQGRVLRRAVPSLSPRERTGTGLFSTDQAV
jgi:malate dehydrogenase